MSGLTDEDRRRLAVFVEAEAASASEWGDEGTPEYLEYLAELAAKLRT